MRIRSTRATVNLDHLRHNLAVIRRLAPSCGVAPVVKADAYGHGSVAVSRALSAAGAQMLSVVLVEEGIELRQAGIDMPILVLGSAYDGGYEAMIEHNLTPAIGRVDQLQALAKAAGDGKASLHLKIDTGMNRLGIQPDEVEQLADALSKHPNLNMDGVLSHFANADLGDRKFNKSQLQSFHNACKNLEMRGHKPQWRHIANSAAVLSFPEAHGSLLRPGLAVYGYNPMGPKKKTGLRPVMSWTTQPVHIKTISKGCRVSYGGVWTAKRDSRIATLPVGYADGYPRSMTGKASVLVGGMRVPVVGRICMDLIMADVTDAEVVDLSSEIVLMGEQGNESITADDLAKWAGTIPYEIICCVGRRVPRTYVSQP